MQTDLALPKDHGPRHGVFYQAKEINETYFYLVNEKANMVHTYLVTYDGDNYHKEATLKLEMKQDFQLPVKKGSAAAEIPLTVCLLLLPISHDAPKPKP